MQIKEKKIKAIRLIFALCFILPALSIQAQHTQCLKPEALKCGQEAPKFSIVDHNKKTLTLDSLLLKGKVVIMFYRGAWCPYCNLTMKAVQDSMRFFIEKNAYVIAITPDGDEEVDSMVAKAGIQYSIVHDKNYDIMTEYKTAFAVDDTTLEIYKQLFSNLTVSPDRVKNELILPVPASYVINRDGKIEYVFFNENYKIRPSVADILSHL